MQDELRDGRIAIDFAVACQNDALDAEVELAESHEQRVKLRKEMLNNLKKVELFAELNAKHGSGAIHERLAAKAARIAADIALRREQRTK